jgi:hypothetical protein
MSVDQVAEKFNILDLSGTLTNYLTNGDSVHTNIHHSHGDHTIHPFAIEVWTKVQIQNCSYHAPHDIQPAQTANALPPSTTWPSGHADTILININSDSVWPHSGLNGMTLQNFLLTNSFLGLGHQVVQLHLIFYIVPPTDTLPTLGMNKFLLYVQHFNVVPQCNQKLSGSTTQKGPYLDPASQMFILKCALHQDVSIIRDVVPLNQLRALVELISNFGEKADPRLTKESLLEYSTHFWLDNYFDKELFYALRG